MRNSSRMGMTVLSSSASEETHADTRPPFSPGRMAVVEAEDCCLSMTIAIECAQISHHILLYDQGHFLYHAHACHALYVSFWRRTAVTLEPGNECMTCWVLVQVILRPDGAAWKRWWRSRHFYWCCVLPGDWRVRFSWSWHPWWAWRFIVLDRSGLGLRQETQNSIRSSPRKDC